MGEIKSCMKIAIVTPSALDSTLGNSITAQRWVGILEELGHAVNLSRSYEGGDCDLLIVLHARRSHPSITRFSTDHPGRPLVLALTGTDLYGDIRNYSSAKESLELASRLIVLQRLGQRELPVHLRPKVRVIYQSAVRAPDPSSPDEKVFEVCVIGHLRAVKDPLRAAMAARGLPPSSRIRIIHMGKALDGDMQQQAENEMTVNPRYRWLGEVPRNEALATLARSRLLVISSRLEGGANAICEAIAASVPVVSSRIPGSVGILGEEYPGYFSVGDTQNLSAILQRAEMEPAFYRSLASWCEDLRHLVDPEREKKCWVDLLGELEG